MINSSSRLIFFVFVLLSASCSKTDTVIPGTVKEETPSSTADVYAAIRAVFGNEIDPANLANYAN